MSDSAKTPREIDSQQATIASLARETGVPLEAVQTIYSAEQAKLEQTARIKTYVSVLTRRRVKDLLQDQRAAQ
jgi:DNA-binding transcriptional MerR regulator